MLAPHDPDIIAALLGQIAESFADVPRPGDITKSVARALDDEWLVTERRRVVLRERDHEVHWTDLTDKDIEGYWDIFAFLDAESFRFYLPAVMSHALRRHPDSDFLAIDSAISRLTGDPDCLALFNPAQLRCTVDFLTFWAAYGESPTAESAAHTVDYIEQNMLPP